MIKNLFKKHKKKTIAAIVFLTLILFSFVTSIISFSNHKTKTYKSFESSFSTEKNQNLKTTLATIITTPKRDISPYSTDYDKSIDDIKDILKSNKWRGKGKYNVDEGKEYKFTLGNDDIAVISSPQEKEKVLINMKYVKSVIGKYNTYRIVCDLSFQDGKYITDSTLILTFKADAYELRCDDFPIYNMFCIRSDNK